ncbi:uncharacterized protein BO80DRAFT_99137 [Aspergillus ibericus CBS 121593]|uniref:Uncharacterized protein n=1 Tax=Aspergillus ibericus CBS 121593 TaxID=1448316 RepID=A0A395GZJ7_9EURO|nr:hypothetical protein BO80DRAFT_99137 [Aspergillus ibericus CBS 121593]RAL00465.1 hypothetical protein BO80DRAFT_99137 [Aspergillus ibericus CBS 121593]
MYRAVRCQRRYGILSQLGHFITPVPWRTTWWLTIVDTVYYVLSLTHFQLVFLYAHYACRCWQLPLDFVCPVYSALCTYSTF